MAPGFCCPSWVKIPLQRRLAYGETNRCLAVQALHGSLLRRVNHTGSDVRITSGTILNPKAFPRQSCCSSWWDWTKVFACKWARADNINSLELRAIVQSVDWRIKHLKETHERVFHLTDSYVCMSVCSKGRSASRMLQPLLARLSSTLLAWDIHLIITHVESSENPTDDASRA